MPDGATLPRTDAHRMAAIVAVTGAVLILWAQLGGELIPARDGLGFDGGTYAGVVRNPEGWVLGHKLGLHRIQRIAPSLLVHFALLPFDAQADDDMIIHAFHMLNLSLLVGCTYLWWSVSRRLELTRRASWIGFAGLFLTYATWKFPYYYPVLTDVPGFALGFALLWCFLHDRRILMLVVGLLAAWTWPTVWYSALFLYAFSEVDRPVRTADQRWATPGAAAVAALVTGAAAYTYACGTECVTSLVMRSTIAPLLPLSLLVLACWIFFATRPLLRHLDPGLLWRSMSLWRLVVVAGLYAGTAAAQSALAKPGPSGLSQTLHHISLGGAARPGGFLLMHTIYFGPAVVLAILVWRRAAVRIAGYGPAITVLMIGYVLLATGQESRKFVNILPFVVAFATAEIAHLEWERSKVLLFGLLAVISSRVWLPLNAFSDQPEGSALHPIALYRLSIGPHMRPLTYAITGAAALLVVVATWALVRSVPEADRDVATVTRR